MLTEERKKYILEQLNIHGIIKNVDLIEQLNSSQTTIRRDLQELENEGLLQRIHGGARSLRLLSQEDTMSVKSTKNTQEKEIIGKMAAKQIKHGDTIFLDAGTSTYAMIPFLKDKEIQVVTNSIYHANYLVDLSITTNILGGPIKKNTKAVIGLSAYQQLETMQFNKCFLGTNGIDSTSGFTTPDQEEASLKKLAIQQSQQTYILADHSKYDQIYFSQFASTKAQHHLITNDCPSNYYDALKNYHIMEVKK